MAWIWNEILEICTFVETTDENTAARQTPIAKSYRKPLRQRHEGRQPTVSA
jgi:hypothetical protein